MRKTSLMLVVVCGVCVCGKDWSVSRLGINNTGRSFLESLERLFIERRGGEGRKKGTVCIECGMRAVRPNPAGVPVLPDLDGHVALPAAAPSCSVSFFLPSRRRRRCLRRPFVVKASKASCPFFFLLVCFTFIC